MGINIQDPEETSDRSSKPKLQSSLQLDPSSPNSDSKTPTPSSTTKTTAKRKAFKVVATTPVRLFIPFVIGVLLTVNHNAPSRTCTATETYSALMSRIVASESPGIVGAISRLAVPTLHAIASMLILLAIFSVLCWLLQLPTFIRIGLRKRNIKSYELNKFHLFVASITPTGLAILLQRIDFIPTFRGCELPALTTSWLPWIPDSWFRTGMSWTLFVIFTFYLSRHMNVDKKPFPSVTIRRTESTR